MDSEKSLAVIFPIADIRVMAEVAYESRLFGVQSVDQAMALMLLAQAKKMHPMAAIERYHIMDGRPSMKAETMLAEFLDNDGRVEWIQLDDQAAIAKFTHPKGGEATIPWTIETARQAGLLDKKGGVWQKYPRAMLRSRCISEGIRTVFPGAVLGIYTPEEAESIGPVKREVREGVQPGPGQKWSEHGNIVKDDEVVDLKENEVFELKTEGEKDNG